jgi:glycosyltransferase involved in cell wall biosynthesis
VDSANVPALAIALKDLLENPGRAKALGERAAYHARAHYDLRRMVGRYANLYEQALGAKDEALSRLSATRESFDIHRA